MFLFLSSEPSRCLQQIFHTDVSGRWAGTWSELVTAGSAVTWPWCMACLRSRLLPESFGDFGVKQGLLSCCSSSFSSSQTCVTFRSILLKSFKVIFWLCQLGRMLTGEHHFSVTVCLSVICTNAWLMRILLCSGSQLSVMIMSCIFCVNQDKLLLVLWLPWNSSYLEKCCCDVLIFIQIFKGEQIAFCFKQSKLPPQPLEHFACLYLGALQGFKTSLNFFQSFSKPSVINDFKCLHISLFASRVAICCLIKLTFDV